MIKFKPHEEDKHGVTIKKEQREKNHTYQEGQVPSHLISSKRKKEYKIGAYFVQILSIWYNIQVIL